MRRGGPKIQGVLLAICYLEGGSALSQSASGCACGLSWFWRGCQRPRPAAAPCILQAARPARQPRTYLMAGVVPIRISPTAHSERSSAECD